MVLCNTRYIDAALTALRSQWEEASDEDAARLSPLGDKHVSLLGGHAFTPPAGPQLRPLRDPASPDYQ